MNAFLSLPVSLPVSLSPTQLDAMLIRLPLTSRIVQLPQTFEMYTPFNQFCLSGIVGWMTGKKIGLYSLLCNRMLSQCPWPATVCVSKCVYNFYLVDICVISGRRVQCDPL